MKIENPKSESLLPTFPAVAARVIELFSDDDVPIVELAKTIQTDPVLTAKVLRVANSALYRSKSEITTLAHAVSWLGKSEITALVLSFKLADFSAENRIAKQHFDDYWRQSFVQAQSMKRISEVFSQVNGNEAFVAGLLMDLGRLVLLDGYAEQYSMIIEQAEEQRADLHKVEQELLETNHAELGGQLIENMGLPSKFVDIAKYHIVDPSTVEQTIAPENFPLAIAAITAAATGDFFCRRNQMESLQRIEKYGREFMGFSASDLDWLIESLRVDIEEKAKLFNVETSEMRPVSALVGRAREQVSAGNACEMSESAQTEFERLRRENDKLKQTVRALESRICIDSLTQIYNRDYFQGRLEEKIFHCRNEATSVALLVMDIDQFRLINDNHGHLAGDCAISMTAKIIDDFFDESAVVARYGGDEFVVLLEVGDINSLQRQSVDLCKTIETQTPGLTGRPHPITTSIGGVMCRIDRPIPSLDSMIFNAADRALYQSKDKGGNTVTITELAALPSATPADNQSDATSIPQINA